MSKSATEAREKKAFWTPTRLASTFVVLAMIAAFLFPSCKATDEVKSRPETGAVNANASRNPNTPVGAPTSPVPLDPSVLNTELKDLKGKTFKLSDYNGKIVIVNLWATWCGPCRSEIPELIKLYNDYKSRGVELVGLTNENPVDDKAAVENFVAQQNIPYRIGWGTQSLEIGLMQGNIKNVVPQSFVITGDGRVFARFTGFNPISTPQRLREAVEGALTYKG